MEQANLYDLLAKSEEKNAVLEKRIKGFEMNNESLSNEVDRQRKELESLRRPKRTYYGKPYLKKAA